MTESLPPAPKEKESEQKTAKDALDNQAIESAESKVNDTEPPYIARVFRSYLHRIQSRIAAIRAWKLTVWAAQYNPSQWCYFVAGILLIFGIQGEEENNYLFAAGWVAFFGLGRELLHLFQRIWDTTLGKGAILILYASTANIALAYAAMKINLISGVEPMPFVFTLGFTTLVLMPFWITLSTVMFFLIFLVLANLWILARLPLKLIGLNIQLHWEDKKRAVLTMFLRIALIPFALISILQTASPYFADFMDGAVESASISEQMRQNIEREFAGADTPEPEQNAPQQSKPLQENPLPDEPLSEESLVQESQDDKEPFRLDLTAGDDEAERAEAIRKGMIINKLIADFMWHFESYPNSFCQKPEGARTVPIEEGVVLFITKDEENEIGYRYTVAECVLRDLPSDDEVEQPEG